MPPVRVTAPERNRPGSRSRDEQRGGSSLHFDLPSHNRVNRPILIVLLRRSCAVLALYALLPLAAVACQLVDPIDDLDRGRGDAAAPGDSSPSGSSGIVCGDATCPFPEVCCYAPDAGIGACTSSMQCDGGNGYPYLCRDHADCVALGSPSDDCCVYFGATTVIGSSCASSCGPNNNSVQLCDPFADAECTMGSCSAFRAQGAPPYYFNCQ
jgi:hypothetical protein